MSWLRVRFKTEADDYRPVIWPPEGPYWCSGYSRDDDDQFSILIAYVRSEEQLMKQWPEAYALEPEQCDEITFTDRFPEPDWWRARAAWREK